MGDFVDPSAGSETQTPPVWNDPIYWVGWIVNGRPPVYFTLWLQLFKKKNWKLKLRYTKSLQAWVFQKIKACQWAMSLQKDRLVWRLPSLAMKPAFPITTFRVRLAWYSINGRKEGQLRLSPNFNYRTNEYLTGHDIHQYAVRNSADWSKNARDWRK